ncbi:multidrug DMT transporter permease [Cupriavidus necator]|uniref:Multidrug DMT transporter permease n=1 Tax=Cupriavidus necator TaxID=106590 RepID=A0A1U9UQR3_CUPNE|nr:DMT family transporter [Cupriavidus necator]AQV94909.1 multidrug DMT transporter permease [Cupriavidus necator]
MPANATAFAPVYALFLIASMALVGSNVGLGKSIIAHVPVLLFALLRFVIAIVCLAPWYRPARMRRVSRGEWLNLFLQAFFGTFLFTLLMLNGVRLTSAMAAGVITSTIPATVAILSWLLLRERLSRRTVLSVLLAMTGIAVLNIARGNSHGAGNGSQAWLGNLMIMGAVVCESIYVILSRRLTQTLAAIEICAYTHLIGGLLMLPLGLVPLLSFDAAAVPAQTWLMVLWYALSASVFSFWLWMKGIRHVPAQLAGVFTSVLPVAAATYGVVFLGEQPGWPHAVALACVLTGIVVASWPGPLARAAWRSKPAGADGGAAG